MIDIPKEYIKDLSITNQLTTNIKKTHYGVEDMALFSTLADIANRACLIIGVNGTGKSAVSKFINNSTKRQVISPHGLTPAGLKHYGEMLNNTSTTVIVEDLSRSGGEYMQINTVSLLCGLSYTHFLSKHSHSVNIEIENCVISAIIYAQPLIMKTLVSVNEFDSDIKDKCLRFYQLKRPLKPNPEPIEVIIKYDTLDRHKENDYGDAIDKNIVNNLRIEVSRARAEEHCTALVQASALLNNRTSIKDADFWVIERLTKICRIENYMFSKKELEGARETDVNVIPLLTALQTYKKENTVKSISLEYQLSESRTRQILIELGHWVMINDNHVYPTRECENVLREITA